MKSARTVLVSPSAGVRVDAALAWLAKQDRRAPLLVVGATSLAVDRLLRRAIGQGAAFGWRRATFSGLALERAARPLASEGLLPSPALAREAVVARVLFDLAAQGRLGRYQPIGDRPGLPRALVDTLEELRLHSVRPGDLPVFLNDLATIYRRVDDAMRAAGLADRAAILAAAAQAAPTPSPPAITPCVRGKRGACFLSGFGVHTDHTSSPEKSRA